MYTIWRLSNPGAARGIPTTIVIGRFITFAVAERGDVEAAVMLSNEYSLGGEMLEGVKSEQPHSKTTVMMSERDPLLLTQ